MPRIVTYGPFPGGWPCGFDADFQRITGAGFNALRLYEMPDRRLLDAAWHQGLRVFGGLKWGQNADFFRRPGLLSAARVELARALADCADHPALAGVYVANEIPTDLVRWMGPLRVRESMESLISLGRRIAPQCLFAYANYPSTEYLEPDNADFTAFNIYLEEESAFRSYLKRLHHIAGDRPLVVSEFGLDSQRNGEKRQADTLAWAARIAREEECAGMTVFSWSDRWWNNGAEVRDWDFGLNDRQGVEKPALAALSGVFSQEVETGGKRPIFSVIICTRNGRDRIRGCLDSVARMSGCEFETIVVDDGSDDGTAEVVAAHASGVKLLKIAHSGLSAARNAGAAIASGTVLAFTDDDCEPDPEWLARLCRVLADGRFAAAGGPNLPPPPTTLTEAVVCAAPGGPSHVMLDDEEAEHLPGCNLAVTKAAFDAIGGFDTRFHTAGDDVDFCWRLRTAGFRLGFAPGAFVWHWRRPFISSFLRQQAGYGRAERLLMKKFPDKITSMGGAIWEGVIYAGGPVRVADDSIIYHGAMGMAGFQRVSNRMLPLRKLSDRFHRFPATLMLAAVTILVPRVRAWTRSRAWWLWRKPRPTPAPDDIRCHDFEIPGISREDLLDRLLRDEWITSADEQHWDLEKAGTKVLLARQYGDCGYPISLVRIAGNLDAQPSIIQTATTVKNHQP